MKKVLAKVMAYSMCMLIVLGYTIEDKLWKEVYRDFVCKITIKPLFIYCNYVDIIICFYIFSIEIKYVNIFVIKIVFEYYIYFSNISSLLPFSFSQAVACLFISFSNLYTLKESFRAWSAYSLGKNFFIESG